MNETTNVERWESRWENLPDPTCLYEGRSVTCTIAINEGLWNHNNFKHLRNPEEPWEDLLGDSLCAEAWRLAQNDGQLSNTIDILRRITEALEDEVRRSLERPLALVFDLHVATSEGKWLLQRWLLILPAGAMFRVRKRKPNARTAYAESCYFPDTVRRCSSDRRWVERVEELALAFGKNDGGELTVRDMDERLSSGPGRQGVRDKDWDVEARRVRFALPATWGFGSNLKPEPWRRDLVPAWMEPGAPTAISRLTSVPSPLAPLPKWEGEDI